MKPEGRIKQTKPKPGPEPLRLKIAESELGPALSRIMGAGKPPAKKKVRKKKK